VRILSLQSLVAYGHVGNSAAVFPLQRLGHEVWPVPTVVFSNHTGYGAWRGRRLAAEEVREIVTGIEERGVLTTCDAVLSGYLGSAEMVDVVLETVQRVKAANPAATYTCDPVMGNLTSGCFVAPEIPALIRDHQVPSADLVTPNQFELGYLTGSEPRSLEETLEAADAVRARGPSVVLVTSMERRPGGEVATVEMLAVDGEAAWLVSTPRLPMHANGSGDLTAALFTAHLHETGAPAAALATTASSVYGVLRETCESGDRELRLVAAQQAIAEPAREFAVRRVR
jgi:pyridoxine kinase